MEIIQNIIPQIGYGFVCSFWQMAFLLGLYKFVVPIYIHPPSERFRLALFLSVVGSIWFIYTIIGGQPSQEWQVLASFANNIQVTSPGAFNHTMYFLGCIYLGMLAFSSIKGHLQWKSTVILMKAGQGKAPVEWRMFTEKHAAMLGIKKKVILRISGTFSPATFGFLKPVILLPASCLTGLNTIQLQAILLHELAHIRRGDYLAGWVMQIAGILLYFNPFMRELIREAKKECEHACDDLVMQFEYNPVQYAQALLSVAKTGQHMAWVLQAQGSQQPLLLNRITRLLGQPYSNNKFSWKRTGLFILAAAIFLGTTTQQDAKNQVLKESYRKIFMPAFSVSYPQHSWEQSLGAARLAIRQGTANNFITKQKGKTVPDVRVVKLEELPSDNFKHTEEHKPEFNTKVSPLPAVNQIDEQQTEVRLQEMELAWKQFSLLLEKLDLSGNLEEKEWQQIAGLISLHADIRNAIYEETSRSQNLPAYAITTASETSGKILVIVHDETSGKLAASFMHQDELNATYAEVALPENRQQVILLRKKAATGKKIIRL